MTRTTAESYASIAARGVLLSEPERAPILVRTLASYVSFSLSKRLDGSPIRSPPTLVGQLIRSAIKKTAYTQETDMIIDLSKLNIEEH
jgi:hypothetical protein